MGGGPSFLGRQDEAVQAASGNGESGPRDYRLEEEPLGAPQGPVDERDHGRPFIPRT